MLAKRVGELPEGDDWIFEPKWDGFRALVFRDGDEIFIQSRDEKPLNRYFPELVDLCGQRFRRAVCSMARLSSSKTMSSISISLQLRLHPAASRVKLLSEQTPASFVFFDLLCLGDRDLCGEPFENRRRELESLISSAAPPIHLTPATSDRDVAADWFRRFEGAGLDGVIAKPIRRHLRAQQARDVQGETRTRLRLRGGGISLAQKRRSHAGGFVAARLIR